MKKSVLALLLITFLSSLIAFTTSPLLQKTRIGLEFKGGYEILYVAQLTSCTSCNNAIFVGWALPTIDQNAYFYVGGQCPPYTNYRMVQDISQATEPGKPVDKQALLRTAEILGDRTNTLGVAEPDVVIEGNNQIRVKLAGVSSGEQVRAILNQGRSILSNILQPILGSLSGVVTASISRQRGLIEAVLF